MVVLTERRETTGAPAKLVLRPAQSKIAADGEYVSSIAVEVCDSQGRFVPTASNKVRFNLIGAGKIIGVGNGDPSRHETDKPDLPNSAVRSSFGGLSIVFVQATKEPGSIQLEVSADDLESAQVVIHRNAAELRGAVG